VLTGLVKDPFCSGPSDVMGIGSDGIYVRAEYDAFMNSLDTAIGQTQAALNGARIDVAPENYFSTLSDVTAMDKALEAFENSPPWVQARGFDTFLEGYARREGLGPDFQARFMASCEAAGISFSFGATLEGGEIGALRSVLAGAREAITQNPPAEVRMEMLRDMERMQDILENNPPNGFWCFGNTRLSGEDKAFWNEFRDKYVLTGLVPDPMNNGVFDRHGIGSDAAYTRTEYQAFMNSLNAAIGQVRSAGPMSELLAGKVDAFNYFPVMEDLSSMNKLLDAYESRPWWQQSMSLEQYADRYGERMGLGEKFLGRFMAQCADSGILPADFRAQLERGDIEGMRASLAFTADLLASSPPPSARSQMVRDMERMQEIMNNHEPGRWGVEAFNEREMAFWTDFRERYVLTGIVEDPFNRGTNDVRGVGADGVFTRFEWEGFMDSLGGALAQARAALPSEMGLMEYNSQVADLATMQSLLADFRNASHFERAMGFETYAKAHATEYGVTPDFVENFTRDYVDTGLVDFDPGSRISRRDADRLLDSVGRALDAMRAAPPRELHEAMLTDMEHMMEIMARHMPGPGGTGNMIESFTPEEMAFWNDFRAAYVDTGLVADPMSLPWAPQMGIGTDGVFVRSEWSAFVLSLGSAMQDVRAAIAAESAPRPSAETYVAALGDLQKMDALLSSYEMRPWWQRNMSLEQFAAMEGPRMGLAPGFVDAFKAQYVDTGLVPFDFGANLDAFEAGAFHAAVREARESLRTSPPPDIQVRMLADMQQMAEILERHKPAEFGGPDSVQSFTPEEMAFWNDFRANYVLTGIVDDPMNRGNMDSLGIGSDGVFVRSEWDAFRESLLGTMEQMREASPLATVQADRYVETMSELQQMNRVLDAFRNEPWFVQASGLENYIANNYERLGVSEQFFGDFKRDHMDSGRVSYDYGHRLTGDEVAGFRAALAEAARTERANPPVVLHTAMLADMEKMAGIMESHRPGPYGSTNMVESFTPGEMAFWNDFRATYVETGIVPDPFDRGGSDVSGIGSDGVFVRAEWDAFMNSLNGAMADLSATRPSPLQEMRAEMEQLALLYPETADATRAVLGGDTARLEELIELLTRLLEMLLPDAEAEAARLQGLVDGLDRAAQVMEGSVG
jgi:uncharacterized membrane protein